MKEQCQQKFLERGLYGYCGVGLWILPAFVNHSCCPNVRRLHIGDWLVIHASRVLKAGEGLTFPYFDVLLPLNKLRELSMRWGFHCNCERCKFEEKEEEIREMEVLGSVCGLGNGDLVIRLEEGMKEKVMGKKERGFLRSSFWVAYSGVYKSEKLMIRRLGRGIPAELVLAESVMDAVGGDERLLKSVFGSLKKDGGGCGSRWVETERMMKMGRGIYGKVGKKQGMRALFEQLNW